MYWYSSNTCPLGGVACGHGSGGVVWGRGLDALCIHRERDVKALYVAAIVLATGVGVTITHKTGRLSTSSSKNSCREYTQEIVRTL